MVPGDPGLMARPTGHARFSRTAMELRLRSALELIERRLQRDYHHTINLADPSAPALKANLPPQQVLLIGQWVATKDLLDDIRDDLVRA